MRQYKLRLKLSFTLTINLHKDSTNAIVKMKTTYFVAFIHASTNIFTVYHELTGPN